MTPADVVSVFQFAANTTEQLITLSTGIVGLTLTYASGPGKTGNLRLRRLLVGSWLVFLVSIVAGVATLAALTGHLGHGADAGVLSPGAIYAPNVRLFSGIQALSFVLGVLCTVLYGISSLKSGGGR